MSRVPFSQVLKNAEIDLRREYDRLYSMFYLQKIQINQTANLSMRDYCAGRFFELPFRGTCLSLDDFDEFYGYYFEKVPSNVDIDYLVTFCEYTYNLAVNSQSVGSDPLGLGIVESYNMIQPIRAYILQVMKVIDVIGYMENRQGIIVDFCPKDQAAISVAETVDSELSYKVIEYNHHSMKGDLNRKKEIIIALSNQLEAQKDKLSQIDSSLKSDLFYLFNNISLRHNNSDISSKYFHQYVANMKDEDLEQWYDETYQMCLLAFLELEQVDRKKRVKQLKSNMN